MDTDATAKSTSSGGYLPVIARVLMGLMFLIFGLNGFLSFIPQPKTPMPAEVMALMSLGYMMKINFAVQLLVGILLLVNRFVPLALALIAPILVNIVALHVFLKVPGLPIAMVPVLLELYLVWAYRKAFLPMLAPRVTPG